jgi:hypothetical protein
MSIHDASCNYHTLRFLKGQKHCSSAGPRGRQKLPQLPEAGHREAVPWWDEKRAESRFIHTPGGKLDPAHGAHRPPLRSPGRERADRYRVHCNDAQEGAGLGCPAHHVKTDRGPYPYPMLPGAGKRGGHAHRVHALEPERSKSRSAARGNRPGSGGTVQARPQSGSNPGSSGPTPSPGDSDGRPCAARARSHCGLGNPFSQAGESSRHTEGRV